MNKKIEDLKYKALWDNDDIQESLRYLRDNPDEEDKLVSAIKAGAGSDRGALLNCIEEGWYEEFDRYDSDVSEQYIYWFRDIILNSEYIDCPDGVRREFDDYKGYVKHLAYLHFKQHQLLTPEETELVEKSGWADFWRGLA